MKKLAVKDAHNMSIKYVLLVYKQLSTNGRGILPCNLSEHLVLFVNYHLSSLDIATSFHLMDNNLFRLLIAYKMLERIALATTRII